MACGDMGRMMIEKGTEKPDLRVLSCRSMLFNLPKFIPAEAMGTELPCRFPACRNCRECLFQMDSLSF